MIPFLYFALADTVVAPVDPQTVIVHEWGVIEVDMSFPEARGARWGYLRENGELEPWTEYEVEAPVVWFHGADCTGTLTITARQGYFTTLLPRPDSITSGDGERMMSPDAVGSQTAVWEDVSIRENIPEIEEELLPVGYDAGGFGWALPFWREVEANTVIVPGSSYRDSFIYYECTAASIPGIDHTCEGGETTYGYSGQALVFAPDGDGISASVVLVDDGIETVRSNLTGPEITAVLCGWGDGLKSSEIRALWNTWAPVLRQRCNRGGERVMMFPLSVEQTESISTVSFVPDEVAHVDYARLFLAVGSIGFD